MLILMAFHCTNKMCIRDREYIGYCLIPSNKGQRMMVIKGNGGEGKSQIGAVLGLSLIHI